MVNFFKRYRNLWMLGIIAVLAILFIVNISVVVSGFQAVWNSITGLLYGAMLAFVLNLIMDPIEKALIRTRRKFLVNKARPLALMSSILIALMIIALILSIIIPNMVSAFTVLANEAPSYGHEMEDFITQIGDRYPQIQTFIKHVDINWTEVGDTILSFVTKGFSSKGGAGSAVTSTLNLVSSMVGGAVNFFVIVIFAIYVLADKERFVKLYYFFTDLYLKPITSKKLTRNMRIINSSFKAFVGGEIIEAGILSTMCIVGMFILRLPYAMMIGILVGVINMIPMVGAFIGGGIGAFILFTVSPVKCLIFLIFLIVIQQIESNIFFPKVIGNRVGLPGIYVMMTIVVGGSLFGVLGMILGVPLVAALYKILTLYFEEKARERHHACAVPDRKKKMADTAEQNRNSLSDQEKEKKEEILERIDEMSGVEDPRR